MVRGCPRKPRAGESGEPFSFPPGGAVSFIIVKIRVDNPQGQAHTIIMMTKTDTPKTARELVARALELAGETAYTIGQLRTVINGATGRRFNRGEITRAVEAGVDGGWYEAIAGFHMRNGGFRRGRSFRRTDSTQRSNA